MHPNLLGVKMSEAVPHLKESQGHLISECLLASSELLQITQTSWELILFNCHLIPLNELEIWWTWKGIVNYRTCYCQKGDALTESCCVCASLAHLSLNGGSLPQTGHTEQGQPTLLPNSVLSGYWNTPAPPFTGKGHSFPSKATGGTAFCDEGFHLLTRPDSGELSIHFQPCLTLRQ